MTDATIPADLRAAFEAYERAIVANDLDALDASFAPGPETLRGDSGGLLVGHDAISGFRSLRGGVPPREIADVHYRPLARGSRPDADHDVASIDGDVALLVSVSRFTGGGRGLQTQVWERVDGRWVITAAHVTPRTPAFDRSIWRSVGDPFLQGAWEGPLAGLTVAVKDLFAIAGFRIGAGNPTYLEQARPEKVTAPAVADLLRAGASLRGIARTDEFAYSIAGDNVHYGTPPNGAVVGALPGGSSSGPAAAVALGHADVGLATDTAGSIRVPASYQGLWGLRTTHDLVPRQGMLPLAQSFDTIGWLTRDGDTLQRVADWCLSYDGSASTENVYGASGDDLPWRFLVPEEILDCVDPDTRAVFSRLLAALAASEDPPSLRAVDAVDVDATFTAFRTVQGAEAWRNDGEWLRAHP
ncbi:AtzH-like domain-containing protein, partial [Microbacterium sp. HMWF026]|uniref:AtzH-like domain-containing protein n=1 Tax=Microbacterium sp. HMWF026 TaxID=2056861 RepID=UPI002159EFC2